jgi:hypothetical protein
MRPRPRPNERATGKEGQTERGVAAAYAAFDTGAHSGLTKATGAEAQGRGSGRKAAAAHSTRFFLHASDANCASLRVQWRRPRTTTAAPDSPGVAALCMRMGKESLRFVRVDGVPRLSSFVALHW